MYNFDEIIDRKHSNALNTDGFRKYIFHADDSMSFPYSDEDLIRLWVADMDFATPEVVMDAIRERLDRRILGYTQLREEGYYDVFRTWCRERYDWDCPTDKLLLSQGVVPALFTLAKQLCHEGERVLFLTPSYGPFLYATLDAGREHVCSDLIERDSRYEIDFDDLERKASDPQTTLFILCHPHNPTGRVFGREELERIADIMQRHGLWVVSDEIHCDLLRLSQSHIPLAKVMPDYDRLITCMAPSKTFNVAGLMVSHVIIKSDTLRAQWKESNFNFTNPLSIAASQGAYERGAPWLDALRIYLDESFSLVADYLAEHLPEAKFSIPEATYLAWIDVRAYCDDNLNLPLFFANNAGVLLEGGDAMFVHQATGRIRLNIACPRAVVAEGLKRIVDALVRHHR